MQADFGLSYQHWLFTKFDPDGNYTRLFDKLYRTEYEWVLPMDENRAEDGRYLRSRFAVEKGFDVPNDYDDIPCSVLEMLGGLAFRADETIMYSAEYGERVSVWFWMMLDNLDLSAFTDARFDADPVRSEAIIDDILLVWMHGKYAKNGQGGLFPSRKGNDYDARKTEIWLQMCDYFANLVP